MDGEREYPHQHQPPLLLVRIWQAALRYWGTKTLEPLTLVLLQKELERDNQEPHSLSAICRLRHELVKDPGEHPDWFPWPIERGMRPPFPLHAFADPIDPKPEDRLQLLQPDGSIVEAAVDRDSGVMRLVRGDIVAAGISGFYCLYTLDFLSDGVVDHIIHMCQLFAHIASQLTTY